MKLRSFITFVVVILMISTGNSYAGFVMKKSVPAADSVALSGTTYNEHNYSKQERVAAYKTLKNLVLHEGTHDGSGRTKSTSGWEGIVALCCGVLGIFTFGLTSIPAIIFGAIGLGRGKKNQGMAIAGLVLGILMVFIVALMIILVSSFYL